MAPARARYSAWRCAAAVTRSSLRTAGAPTAARSSLWTRSISVASFDLRSLAAADGAELGDALASRLGETAVGAGVAEAVAPSVPDEEARGCRPAMNPTSATPAASAA